MKTPVFVFIVLSFVFLNVRAQDKKVLVKGFAPSYSGKTVDFFTYREKQFESRINVASTKIDSTGHFSFISDCRYTQALYCETPVFTGYFFIEPGRDYSIPLPPIPPPELQSIGDPFFISPLWHILPKDSLINGLLDLNYAIRDYDIEYEPFAKKQLLRYNNPELSRTKLDSFLLARQSDIRVTDPVFYRDHITYRTALMEFMVSQYKRPLLYTKYFKDRSLPINNPAFWDFYKLYFDHYISSLTVRNEFADVYQLMGNEQYDELTKKLKNDPVLQNDTIREFVLLNELYQGFYEKHYPLQLTLDLIDTIGRRSAFSVITQIAANLLNSITSMQPGYYPPGFTLYNVKGKEYTPESLKGKYCYIGFCSLSNLGCQKEFEYLKYQDSKHRNYLQIITIVPEKEKEEISSFVDFNSITWLVLYSKDGESLCRDYKVKAFPSFFLIDKDGKLVLSPSPLPSENFEQALFRVMRSKGDI